jgi:hypothetical protein
MAWLRVCVVAWLGGALLVCVGFMRFLGVVVLVVGLVWLAGGYLGHLCGGFALFVSMIQGVRLF